MEGRRRSPRTRGQSAPHWPLSQSGWLDPSGRSYPHGWGFTLVELVVSLSIMALLAALLVPAVQRVRESSRRNTCLSNLRQIGLAMSLYEQQWRSYPPLSLSPVFLDGLQFGGGGLAAIFPYLELPPNDALFRSGVSTLPILTCPSHPDLTAGTNVLDRGPANYLLSAGPGEHSGVTSRGLFVVSRRNIGVKLADVVDGLSHTAMASEKRRTEVTKSEAVAARSPSRYSWFVQAPELSQAARDFPERPSSLAERRAQTAITIDRCLNGPRFLFSDEPGQMPSWLLPGSGYTQWVAPNAPHCNANTPLGGAELTLAYYSPASSHHWSGVNQLMADGSARFISDHISQEVWRAMGTMNGGEVVGEP